MNWDADVVAVGVPHDVMAAADALDDPSFLG
jgi:hypothetical protein